MEDMNKNGQATGGDTVTPTTPQGENNNTTTVSEDVNTQQSGSVPYSRFKEVNDRLKELERNSQNPAQVPVNQPVSPTEDLKWKKNIELQIGVPDYLKEKQQDMTDYWLKNPGLSKTDVIKLFTPVDVLVKQAQVTDQQANDFQTGGASNPSSKQPQAVYSESDSDEIKEQKLRKELDKFVASGGRL